MIRKMAEYKKNERMYQVVFNNLLKKKRKKEKDLLPYVQSFEKCLIDEKLNVHMHAYLYQYLITLLSHENSSREIYMS